MRHKNSGYGRTSGDRGRGGATDRLVHVLILMPAAAPASGGPPLGGEELNVPAEAPPAVLARAVAFTRHRVPVDVVAASRCGVGINATPAATPES